MRMGLVALGVALAVGVGPGAWGTTWMSQDLACPVCEEQNSFKVIMSYGDYIYRWPTLVEYVFWPYTESQYLYSCRKCKLTLFSNDFFSFPKDKKADMQKLLEGAKFDQEYPDYISIPMDQKLALAEKLYGALGKDDEFWCLFYRVKGFHLAQAKRMEDAKAARRKAVEYADKMLADPKRASIRKEVYCIKGAMHSWLGERGASKAALRASLPLKYTRKDVFDEAAVRAEYAESGEKITPKDLKEMKQEFEEMAKEDMEDKDAYLKDYAEQYLKQLDSPEAEEFLKGQAEGKGPAEPGEQ